MFKLSETSKKIEDDLHQQHQTEMEMLEDEIQSMNLDKVKYSSGLLNQIYKLKFLVKSKNYSAARELQEDIQIQEEKELQKAEQVLVKKINKMRRNKEKKHVNEYDSIKARLEKSINSKLKQRMIEYERLLLRIQNCHNDMMNRQSVEFGKLQSIHSKLLLKYSLNLDGISEIRQGDIYSNQDVIHEEMDDDIRDSELTPRENVLMEQRPSEGNKLQNRNNLQYQNEIENKIQNQIETPMVEVIPQKIENSQKKGGFKKFKEDDFDKENRRGNSQGQINGYWNKKIIKELKPSTMSDMKESMQLDLSKEIEHEPVLSNFHRIPSEHESQDESESSDSSRESNSSGSSTERSGSDSSSSSDSESD